MKITLTQEEYLNILKAAVKNKDRNPNLRWGQVFFDELNRILDRGFIQGFDRLEGLYEMTNYFACQKLVDELLEENV